MPDHPVDFSEPVPVHPGTLRMEREEARRRILAVALLVAGVVVLLLAVLVLVNPGRVVFEGLLYDDHRPLFLFVVLGVPAAPLLWSCAAWLALGHLRAGRLLMHGAWILAAVLAILSFFVANAVLEAAAPRAPVTAPQAPATVAVPGGDGTLGA